MIEKFKKIKTKNDYVNAFLLSLLLATVVFLPFIIMGKGHFIYYIDFNVQQIPFYKLAHEAVRSGNIFWNWNTDLGANFIGSYSFYLLGSPFFWVTLLFPNWAIPYLMGPLMILKFACCGVAGYAFIKRFAKTQKWALLGSVLYAFCGFNACNVVFNHFHEAVIIFPLMLVAMESFVINGRRGWFAFMVFWGALVNYFFFAGQVAFLIIYFAIRCFSKDFTITWKKFLLLAFEAVLGTLMACVILLPAALAIMGNPRTQYSLWGMHVLIYSKVERYFLILQSMFFPPDNIMMPNFFKESEAHFASVSLYLPLFSMAGVIVFLKKFENTWLKKIIIISGVMAMVPVLNSAFFAFNGSYYARWFYMPTLMMALATVVVLEDNRLSLKKGFHICCGFVLFFSMIGVVPNYVDGVKKWFHMPNDIGRFWIYVAIAVAGLLLLWVVDRTPKTSEKFFIRAMAFTCVMGVSTTFLLVAIGHGAVAGDEYQVVIETGVGGKENFDLEEGYFYRVDTIGLRDNLTMYWDMHSMQCFHSIVPVSVTEFYDSIGYDRGVGSRAGAEYNGVRGLSSVKYMFCTKEQEEKAQMFGFQKIGEQNGYSVYENTYFIPMGFTYDYYVTQAQLKEHTGGARDELMLQGMVLSPEDGQKYGHILKELPVSQYSGVNEEEYLRNCQLRKETSGYQFFYDNTSFTSNIILPRENLVFYSVPYEKGWSAKVNGKKAEIVKANTGFMAVVAPAGDNEIVFTYKTPGLTVGVIVSLLMASIFGFYLYTIMGLRKKNPNQFGVKRNAHRRHLQYFHKDEE